jgi:hypothetical protein
MRKTMVVENPKVMFGSNKGRGRNFNGGEGKKMDGSVEVLVIICLVQRSGQKGMERYFKIKLPIYLYYKL